MQFLAIPPEKQERLSFSCGIMNRRQNPGSCRQAAAAAPVYLSRTYLLLNLQFLRNLIETSGKIYFHARNCLIRTMTKMDWTESNIRLVVALFITKKRFLFLLFYRIYSQYDFVRIWEYFYIILEFSGQPGGRRKAIGCKIFFNEF